MDLDKFSLSHEGNQGGFCKLQLEHTPFSQNLRTLHRHTLGQDLPLPAIRYPRRDIHSELLVGMNSHATEAPQSPSNCPQHSWEFHLWIQPPGSRKGREGKVQLPLPPSSAMPCWAGIPGYYRSRSSVPLRLPPWLHSKGADTDHCFTVSNSTYSRAALELCGVSNYVLNPTAFANVAVTHFLPK